MWGPQTLWVGLETPLTIVISYKYHKTLVIEVKKHLAICGVPHCIHLCYYYRKYRYYRYIKYLWYIDVIVIDIIFHLYYQSLFINYIGRKYLISNGNCMVVLSQYIDLMGFVSHDDQNSPVGCPVFWVNFYWNVYWQHMLVGNGGMIYNKYHHHQGWFLLSSQQHFCCFTQLNIRI